MTRKTVTLVFCDVVDSTPLGERLDPEALRSVWSRYHDTARAVLERHGGTIEKFIGDAVMAAFGIPLVHEDDPLRAVRAAAELREELTGLNDELERDIGVRIGVRTGVCTGEVFAGDPEQGQAFATGDAVNVAQRLEAAAEAGEILVSDATVRLVRDVVVVEEVPPLDLKGKSEPVRAWRLLEVLPGTTGHSRRLDSPLVGRAAELARVRAEFDQAAAERSCRVLAILGEAGMGKSRLAAELAASAGDDVLVLEGRCLPYGSGITYWPLVEIVRQLDVDAILAGEEDAALVQGRILEAVGRAEPRSRSNEIYWAVRRLFEVLARERPLLLVLDDVQWAEPVFLDLVEYLAGWSHDAPIFVCCLARTEFAEIRPAWATLPLRPLSGDETAELLGNLAGTFAPATVRELGGATGGNPLFLEEMVRMLEEEERLVEEDGALVAQLEGIHVPETIHALLAARLDRLSEDERATLQRAAVTGQVFFWGAVAELSPPERVGAVAADLQALVRKGLIRPDDRTLPGEDSFRFAHILVRDAAYDSAPKRTRAELHERFADWLEPRAVDRADLDEIIGHHLEQAYTYRVELGPAGEAEAELAVRAVGRLDRAGRRASARGDSHAAAKLLGRAASLTPGDAALLLAHADAIAQLGAVRDAEERYTLAAEAGAATGDRRSELLAELRLDMIRFMSRAEGGADELADEIERALPAFEEAGDDATVARLLCSLADAYWWKLRIGPMQDVLERALVHANRAGDEGQAADTSVRLGFAAIAGPLPAAEGRQFVDEALERTGDGTSAKGMLLLTGSLLAALDADFDAARTLAARGTEILNGLGRNVGVAAVSTWTAAIELLAGNPDKAEHDLRAALAQLDAAGQRGNAASVSAQLAEAILAVGRPEEAEALTKECEADSATDDIHAQIAWRVARAKAAAALGQDDAERFAREAVELAYETDSPFYTADALEALAIASGSADAARDALRLYEAKGNVPAAARVRSRAAAARTASTQA